MSIILETPITRIGLNGKTEETITHVKIGELIIKADGQNAYVDILNADTDDIIGQIEISAPAAIKAIKSQIETYVITNSLIEGTQK